MKVNNKKEEYLKDKRIVTAIIIGCIILLGTTVTYFLLENRRANQINLNKEFVGVISQC